VQSDDDFDKAMKIVKKRNRTFIGTNTGHGPTTHERIARAVAEGIRLGRREALTPKDNPAAPDK
jgi:hypothetical protein